MDSFFWVVYRHQYYKLIMYNKDGEFEDGEVIRMDDAALPEVVRAFVLFSERVPNIPMFKARLVTKPTAFIVALKSLAREFRHSELVALCQEALSDLSLSSNFGSISLSEK